MKYKVLFSLTYSGHIMIEAESPAHAEGKLGLIYGDEGDDLLLKHTQDSEFTIRGTEVKHVSGDLEWFETHKS